MASGGQAKRDALSKELKNLNILGSTAMTAAETKIAREGEFGQGERTNDARH